MTMENSGHEETSREANKGQPETDAQVPNPSRRRFNRFGVGASGLMLTLASRSVLAQGACKSPSGYHSANLSGGGPVQPRCAGFTPEVWRQRGVAENLEALKVKFNSVFSPVSSTLIVGKPVAGASATPVPSNGDIALQAATFYQALSGDVTPDVIRHLVAAYLNFTQKLNDFPTDVETVRIYNEWATKGTYTPTAGVTWDAAKIVEYLRATQTYIAETQV
ncbi:MAG: hypothetical protein ABWY05_01040 [Noviherbaspirillum sp.]